MPKRFEIGSGQFLHQFLERAEMLGYQLSAPTSRLGSIGLIDDQVNFRRSTASPVTPTPIRNAVKPASGTAAMDTLSK